MSKPENLLTKAKELFTDTIEAVTDVIGITHEFPQAKVKHQYDFLNDIANGRWKKPLKHVETVDKTKFTKEKFKGYKSTRVVDRTSMWREIKTGRKLKKAETREPQRFFDKDWKLRRSEERKKLCSEIRGFNCNKLRKAPYHRPYFPKYQSDILNTRWRPLKHVDTVDKTQLRYLDLKGWKLKKLDKAPLLKDIGGGRKLKHVETVDKCRPSIEKGLKLRQGDQRKILLRDIQNFGTKVKLRKVQPPTEMKKHFGERVWGTRKYVTGAQ